ncbi:MAG: NADH-quinone oxidoreductase subunit NuoH [Acidobacteriota bacterium]
MPGFLTGWTSEEFMVHMVATLVKIGVVFACLMTGLALMTWVERRVSGWIQDRLGPNRVGPFGLLQPLADGVKFFLKKDIVPDHVYKPIYILAPGISLFIALLAFTVIPFGSELTVFACKIPLVIANINIGILFIIGMSSLGVYGIVMAGWSSNNKYSLMGGLRSSAQMISYELSLAISIVGVLMISGTLRLTEIVERQAGGFWHWNIFMGGWQILGFIIFLVAMFAETNRLPFDLPEAESELVAGYHTEYSSMKFAMFFMAEYINMITASALIVTFFLGGWQLPFDMGLSGNLLALAQMIVFATKVSFFLFLYVWVRWTLPRFRYDQLMRLGWKVLFPLSLLNIIIAGLLVAFDLV